MGGIPSAVAEGESGYLFELDGPVEEICDVIEKNFRDPESYLQLSLSSFQRYRSTLNWEVAGQAARRAIEEAVANPLR